MTFKLTKMSYLSHNKRQKVCIRRVWIRLTTAYLLCARESLLIKKRDLSVCLSVCLSGYTFRHALMSHADILDSDRGHIFRKHRYKNNKKNCWFLRENGKKPAVARVFARQLLCWQGARTYITRFSACVLPIRAILLRKRTHDLTQKFCV